MLITEIKAVFGAFSVCWGWFVPSVRGWLRFPAVARGSPRPRPQTAPGSAGKGKAAQEEPGPQENRGEQEKHAGRGPEKARRGREGRGHLRTRPPGRCWPSRALGAAAPGPGAAGAAGKSPHSSAGVGLLKRSKITIQRTALNYILKY